MNEDARCCGSGTCIIDTEGRCWCGQQWDGQKMCTVLRAQVERPDRTVVAAPPRPPAGSDS